jgi:hypothetical protein
MSLVALGAVPLVLNRDPISITCGILESDSIIVDPSEEEESVCKGLVTVVVDDAGQPCYICQVMKCNDLSWGYVNVLIPRLNVSTTIPHFAADCNFVVKRHRCPRSSRCCWNR